MLITQAAVAITKEITMKHPIEAPIGVIETRASAAARVRSWLLAGATFGPWLIVAALA